MNDLLSYFPAFLLVLVRIASFFVTVPVFSYRNIPTSHKVGLSVILSFILLSTMKVPEIEINDEFILLVLKECIVGLTLGLIAYMVMMGIQIAGGLIDFQMGFAIASVIDPQTGGQSPLLGQYLNILSLLFLLSIDGHHLLIDGIYHSYQVIKIEDLSIALGEESFVQLVTKTFTTMFLIAVQMSLPIVGSIFLVDVALGIIARTVPQLNIFVVGFPVKIIISFVLLIVAMGSMFMVVQRIFEQMLYAMRALMNILGG
ncbi:flagellar biosynthetic protein FliR [Bacillus songklensis]|uniref:Flagellar biosynthetic protein FliR n=1 Tax=Bacillus songklensis TaxID=1069116 RepID=A0ABV8AX65_9BACI